EKIQWRINWRIVFTKEECEERGSLDPWIRRAFLSMRERICRTKVACPSVGDLIYYKRNGKVFHKRRNPARERST
ncbi:MAG: hypothetical protein IKT45_08655, partial [Lachnospiraceae bacterium]|nr:hypothetical protein [Lachnospiraceae bacterium]